MICLGSSKSINNGVLQLLWLCMACGGGWLESQEPFPWFECTPGKEQLGYTVI